MNIAKFRALSIALALLAVVGTVRAEDSREFAIMARATWSAFECSSLASKANDPREQERLFLFGYDQGKQFIAAVQADQVKQEHLLAEAPLIMLLLLQGPTADFMLGRIFESAQESALEDVFKTGDHLNSEEDQVSLARNKFWRMNCQLIGK